MFLKWTTLDEALVPSPNLIAHTTRTSCRDNIATAVTNTIRFDQRNQQDSGATSAPRMPVEPYTTAHHNSEHAPSVGRTRGLTRGVPVIHPPFAHASSGTVDGVGHLELVYACGKRAIRGSSHVSTISHVGKIAERSGAGASSTGHSTRMDELGRRALWASASRIWQPLPFDGHHQGGGASRPAATHTGRPRRAKSQEESRVERLQDQDCESLQKQSFDREYPHARTLGSRANVCMRHARRFRS